MDRAAVWRAGERAAWEAYRRRGYRLLARNWRCPLGEIDLVLERDGLVVVCEVKARTGSAFGDGHEAVTGTKGARLRTLADAFLAAHGMRGATCRLDVASVRVRSGACVVQVFEDAL